MSITIISELLWFLIIVGWVLLIIIGIEADKPLSGGIPGNVDLNAHHNAPAEGLAGRWGEKGAWIVFGLAALSLPFILWWILSAHA